MFKFIIDVFITGIKIDLIILLFFLFIIGLGISFFLILTNRNGIYYVLIWLVSIIIYSVYLIIKKSKKINYEKKSMTETELWVEKELQRPIIQKILNKKEDK
ncbi:hypothetical protein EV697_102115 [Bisgaardia hudsonensis]|uniref:Uncharacterized protein n=1 Tax=Bisgaardia hudsonensis TaxID=109472 RepID=A0A4R2N108_9PAST|nr:hypothetical protein [Bisgaardia hudsonensis]QLB13183.1 hypothetical protein A6A11_05930 [Bisgaardia hudsonensis]TCP13242.1 hypothetical protein EV697_102115 [Bisgaardia hudsonensis]